MNKELLDLLACPQCKGELEYRPDENILICHNCKLKFKIEEEIPILLIEKAEKF
jgi:hypothetical protein